MTPDKDVLTPEERDSVERARFRWNDESEVGELRVTIDRLCSLLQERRQVERETVMASIARYGQTWDGDGRTIQIHAADITDAILASLTPETAGWRPTLQQVLEALDNAEAAYAAGKKEYGNTVINARRLREIYVTAAFNPPQAPPEGEKK